MEKADRSICGVQQVERAGRNGIRLIQYLHQKCSGSRRAVWLSNGLSSQIETRR